MSILFLKACCVAFPMPTALIVSTEISAMAKAIACCLITSASSVLTFADNFLESLTGFGEVKFCGKITAAGTTGPAKHPLPTSSH